MFKIFIVFFLASFQHFKKKKKIDLRLTIIGSLNGIKTLSKSELLLNKN